MNVSEINKMLGNMRFISPAEQISYSFASLTREISCSTVEINFIIGSRCVSVPEPSLFPSQVSSHGEVDRVG